MTERHTTHTAEHAEAARVAAILESRQDERRQRVWNRFMGLGFGSASLGTAAMIVGAGLVLAEPVTGASIILLGAATTGIGITTGLIGIVGKIVDRPLKPQAAYH